MSYSVVLKKGSTVLYTFSSPAPFVDPRHTYDFYPTLPFRLARINKEWKIEGILYGANETAVAAAWTTLVAVLENQSTYPDTCQLLVGSTVVDNIGPSPYQGFYIPEISAPRIEKGWRCKLRFSLTVKANKPLPVSSIVNLEQTDSYSYNEQGLLVRTLTGTVDTAVGTSAYTTAQTLGIVPLPGGNYGYVSSGPGGVNVEKLNLSDTKARFTSIIQQSGLTLPANVGPSYSKSLSVATAEGSSVTTTTVHARGPGAFAQVQAEAPKVGVVAQVLTHDDYLMTADATYVQRKFLGPIFLRVHSYTETGGGPGLTFSERTANRLPVKHVLPRKAIEIVENIIISFIGVPNMAQFSLPPPLVGIDEDKSGLAITWPVKDETAPTVQGDVWVMHVKRVYKAASGTKAGMPDALTQPLFSPTLTGDPKAEITRQDAGLPS